MTADLVHDDEPLPTLVRLRAKGGATVAAGRLTRAERRAGELLVYPDVDRPHTRGECLEAPRPCPWVTCRYHLYLDVDASNGSIKVNFPDLEAWDLAETCSLDVADRGGVTLEEVGAIVNLTRERVRQIEVRGLRRARFRNLAMDEEL